MYPVFVGAELAARRDVAEARERDDRLVTYQVGVRDGTEVHLRPVRSEDEPLLQDLAAHMTPEDCACDFSRRCAGSATPSPRASAISITIAR